MLQISLFLQSFDDVLDIKKVLHDIFFLFSTRGLVYLYTESIYKKKSERIKNKNNMYAKQNKVYNENTIFRKHKIEKV